MKTHTINQNSSIGRFAHRLYHSNLDVPRLTNLNMYYQSTLLSKSYTIPQHDIYSTHLMTYPVNPGVTLETSCLTQVSLNPLLHSVNSVPSRHPYLSILTISASGPTASWLDVTISAYCSLPASVLYHYN